MLVRFRIEQIIGLVNRQVIFKRKTNNTMSYGIVQKVTSFME